MAKSGQVITFYSYKGGTGRTMALSNMAWVLASVGYDVLLIDWDLEAPGLHRYLRAFLVDPELASTPGLIDFVWDCAKVSMTPPPDEGRAPPFPALEDYAVGLDWTFERGSISFIPAGRQDENYAQRVNTFNWDNFYERLGGGRLLNTERKRMCENYDYVLIDSRTGVSDTSSICTVQMPDALAVFFTLNRQSIEGAAAVCRSISTAVKASRNVTLPIYPVPTRIELTERDKRDRATRYARRLFARLLMHVQSNRSAPDLNQQALYWTEVETLFEPFYAYEEVPAAFKDDPDSLTSVLASTQRIARWITKRSDAKMARPSEEQRERVIGAYAFTDEDSRRLEAALPVDSRPSLFAFLDAVWWQLRRFRWQVATVVTVIAAVGALNLLILERANLQVAQGRNAQYQAVSRNTSDTLVSIAKELEGKAPADPVLVGRLRSLSESLRGLEAQ